MQDRFFQTIPSILVCGKGYPSISTRAFVTLLEQRLRKPVLGLADYNPHGIALLNVYRWGSKRSSLEGANFSRWFLLSCNVLILFKRILLVCSLTNLTYLSLQFEMVGTTGLAAPTILNFSSTTRSLNPKRQIYSQRTLHKPPTEYEPQICSRTQPNVLPRKVWAASSIRSPSRASVSLKDISSENNPAAWLYLVTNSWICLIGVFSF